MDDLAAAPVASLDIDASPTKRLALVVLVSIFALIASANAKADELLLSCWGTVEVIHQGKQVNRVGERSSIAVVVDIGQQTLMINDVKWTMSGDLSGVTVASTDSEKGGVTLNRITGALIAHFIERDGLKKFNGECKPAQRLF
ncbi:hypothetical protein [Bradyrhizobium sp. Ec3.3]|uniref:hypothetical protein n=1 Tax=Bradyrhizobium sp. Ec3.3 TaxID=189753 RepID=UPI0012EC471B|nr:hypothetical protein [Bradyrhizobium sp. Ec3.3]